jgi:hypothetical protein
VGMSGVEVSSITASALTRESICHGNLRRYGGNP